MNRSMGRVAFWMMCCLAWPVLLGARGCDPDPVPIGGDVCDPSRCGQPLGQATLRCSDGSIGGGTGRCLTSDGGMSCSWEVRECPTTSCGDDGGMCSSMCGMGLTDCAGTCRDLAHDPLACGACGQTCLMGQVCSDGVCGTTCGAGLVNCAGTCRDVVNDPLACGTCGHACAMGEICSAGACGHTCEMGLVECAGSCHDLATDPLNCGACGQACGMGQACSAGVCGAATCDMGLVECAGSCHDLATDPLNCGACGHACAMGQFCSDGVCGTACSGLSATTCEMGQYCHYAPAHCGIMDGSGRCDALPTGCAMTDAPVCGCDNHTYANECFAAMAGLSVAHTGPCESVTFACGPMLRCHAGAEYCQTTQGGIPMSDPSYECVALPSACGGMATCSTCFPMQSCTADSQGNLTLTRNAA